MRVLHINQSDINGGAALAAYRLHQGLISQGIDSSLLVAHALTDDPKLAIIPRRHRMEYLINQLTFRLGLHTLHSVGSFDIPKEAFFQAADILNFHNLHSTNFSYLAIPKLTRQKPAVYTLHDMWSFTGHCTYSYDCTKWQTGCGRCPYPDTYPAMKRDASHLEWRLKSWIYSHSRLAIVAPSRWLVEQAHHSLLNRFPIHHIPYGIDTEAYQPLDPDLCRRALGIPINKLTLLFGAGSFKDTRKGGGLLLQVLQGLPATLKAEVQLITLGQGGETIEAELGIPTLRLGYVSSDRLKSMAYSAADLFLLPTQADNLPLVLQESMGCGTPMVSFNIGGVPDLVRPGETGYLAVPHDIEDFRNGIVQLLSDTTLREHMAQRCRQIALDEYSLALQSQRYFEIYQQQLA